MNWRTAQCKTHITHALMFKNGNKGIAIITGVISTGTPSATMENKIMKMMRSGKKGDEPVIRKDARKLKISLRMKKLTLMGKYNGNYAEIIKAAGRTATESKFLGLNLPGAWNYAGGYMLGAGVHGTMK